MVIEGGRREQVVDIVGYAAKEVITQGYVILDSKTEIRVRGRVFK